MIRSQMFNTSPISWSISSVVVPESAICREPPAKILALVRIEACRGFVQAQEARLHRDRPRHPDELPLPLGQLRRRRLGEWAEIQQSDRVLRGRALADALPHQLGREGEERRALGCHHEIFPDGEIVEQLRALPGSGEPPPRPHVRGQPGEIASVELDGPVERTNPVMASMNVVLPAPFGPISPTSSPSSTATATESTAQTPPKRTERPVVARTAVTLPRRFPEPGLSPCPRLRRPVEGSRPRPRGSGST